MFQSSREKYCLAWNDFQKTVSKSFGLLRNEDDLCDVTLVSDDLVFIAAHKVVLSASSQFFKSLIKNVKSNSNPLFYLGGVSSKNLNYCLDYMYNGEVQILHEDIDELLTQAQKLQIEGIIFDNDATKSNIMKPPPQPKIMSEIKREIFDDPSEQDTNNLISEEEMHEITSLIPEQIDETSEVEEISGTNNLILDEVKEIPVTENLKSDEVEVVPEPISSIPSEVEDVPEQMNSILSEVEDILESSNLIPEEVEDVREPINSNQEGVENKPGSTAKATEMVDNDADSQSTVKDKTLDCGNWGNLWKRIRPNVPQMPDVDRGTQAEDYLVEGKDKASTSEVEDKSMEETRYMGNEPMNKENCLLQVEKNDVTLILQQEVEPTPVEDSIETEREITIESVEETVKSPELDIQDKELKTTTKITTEKENFQEIDNLLEPDSKQMASSNSMSGKIKISNLEEAKSKVIELTEKTDTGYKCALCSYSNKLKVSVGRHIEIHFDGLVYNCPSCDKAFSTKNTFQFHKWKSCKKGSDTKAQIEAPIDLTEDSSYFINLEKSSDIGQTAKQYEKVLNKIKEFTEVEDGLYKCKLCDFFSSYEQSLRIHIEYRHLEGREYECNICSQLLATDQALIKHKKRMHNEDEIQEPLGKKRKIIKWSRTSDEQIDERTSPIIVDDIKEDLQQKVKSQGEEICDKIKVSSKEEAQIRIGELTQTVQDGFQCIKCGHTTKIKSNLDMHIEIHFDGLKYSCKFCDKVFPNRASLYNHKSKYHRGL